MVKTIMLMGGFYCKKVFYVFYYAYNRGVACAVGANLACLAFRYIMANLSVAYIFPLIDDCLP